MRESKFQADLIKEIKSLYPSCVILKNDANYLQGFPDLIVLYRDTWVALECKADAKAKRQPNQEYYVEKLGKMSYAAFVHPENKEDVLDGIQKAFGTRRRSRISQR